MNPVISHLQEKIAMVMQPSAPPQLCTSIVERMEIAMRRLHFAGHTVDADALAAQGFSRRDIERHWRAAAELARQRSIRFRRRRVQAGRS